MKKVKLYLTSFMLLTISITSCSKEEQTSDKQNEKALLSFNVLVNDLMTQSSNKQAIQDLPICSDDAPSFVKIILTQGDTGVVGSEENPFRIDLVAGQFFTQQVPELELPPGSYTLEYFAVHNTAGEVLWLAPKAGSPLAQFVDNVLPYDFNLGAGVKKYLDVPVLCFDDRDVNEYGYTFFELNMTKTFEYCFFVNYCNEGGRHYPGRYVVDISIDGKPVVVEAMNVTGTNEYGDPYVEPLCLHLPDLPEYDDDEAYLDFTVTLLDWEGLYDAPEMHFSGSLSRTDVMQNFDGEDHVDYRHIKFGCDNGEGSLPEGVPNFDATKFSNPTVITIPYYGPPSDAIYEYQAFEVENGEIGEEAVENITLERIIGSKTVMGIPVVIQHDVVRADGVVVEDTYDWLAQDDTGNLWYMGESVKNYDEMGNFLDTEGSWEAGVDGALPGYWLPADPYVGQFYYQEYYEGKAEDYAEVVALDATVIIDMGTYEEVLVTKDVNPFEPNVYELKYYAPGIGLIKEEGYEDGELVEVVVLTGIIVE